MDVLRWATGENALWWLRKHLRNGEPLGGGLNCYRRVIVRKKPRAQYLSPNSAR